MKTGLKRTMGALLAICMLAMLLAVPVLAGEGEEAAYTYRLRFNGDTGNSGTGGGVVVQGNFEGEGASPYFTEAGGRQAIQLQADSFINLGEAPVDYSQSFSLAFWYNLPGEYSSDPVVFGNKNWNNGDLPGFLLYLGSGNGRQLRLNSANALATGTSGERLRNLDFATLPIGEWNHIALTVDVDNNTLTAYVNGAVTDTLTDDRVAAGFVSGNATLLGQGWGSSGGSAHVPSRLYNANLTSLYSDFVLTAGVLDAAQIVGLAAETGPEPVPQPGGQADVLDVDFTSGSYSDANGKPAQIVGTPVLQENTILGKTVARLDTASALRYPMAAEDYAALRDGFTMESTFYYHDIGTGEKDILSSQQSGGFGLGINSGNLVFWMNGGDFNTGMTVRADRWYHVACTLQPNGSGGFQLTVFVYDQFGLVNTYTKTNSSVNLTPNTPNAYYMYVGGDPDGNGNLQFSADCSVAQARIYNSVLDADALLANANRIFDAYNDPNKDLGADLTIALEGPQSVAANATFTLNLHDICGEHGYVTKLAYDLEYDPELFEFVSRADGGSGTIQETQPGVLHIEHSRSSLNGGTTTQYSANRHGRIVLRTKAVQAATNASFQVTNLDLGMAEGLPVTLDVTGNDIVIVPPGSLDYNGDGVISIGDVAAAPAAKQQEVADAIEGIYPYKRAMILTLDGAGTPFNPDWFYYAPGSGQNSSVTQQGDANFSARSNPYMLELLQTEWAVSHTGVAVGECHSGENYTSILHGIDWHALPSEYRATNNTTGAQYWPDHGKAEYVYPSIFYVLAGERPDRAYASFSEWTNIPNGIIEPYAPVGSPRYTASGSRSFAALTGYINDGSFKNTTLIFLQDDKMDSIGHNSGSAYGTGGGFNGPVFWEEFSKYDDYYRNVIEALQQQGIYEDTFIITNADHGGNKTTHDHKNTHSELGRVIDWEIFIAMGGQTVNPGAVLQGGTNSDISGVVLEALRVEQPASFEGGVFDESTFLSQEEMSLKNRDIEQVIFAAGQRAAAIKLDDTKAPNRSLVAADMVIDLNGRVLAGVETEGRILRQAVTEGTLTLTLLFDGQPETLATLLYNEGAGTPAIREIMLADETGKEVYADLENTQAAPIETKALVQAIDNAHKAMASGLFEDDAAMASLRAVLVEAQALADAPTTQDAVQQMIRRVSEAVGALNLVPDELEKQELQKAIAQGEARLLDITAGKYLPSGRQRLESALSSARNALLNATEQAVVDAALTELTDAMNALVPTPDKTTLNGLITRARALKAEEYTPASFAPVTLALTTAEIVSADPEATATRVTNAANGLQTAIDGLVRTAPSGNGGGGGSNTGTGTAIAATGDTAPAAVYAGVAGLAVVLMFVLAYARRRRRIG